MCKTAAAKYAGVTRVIKLAFQDTVEGMCNKFLDEVFAELDYDKTGELPIAVFRRSGRERFDAAELHLAVLMIHSKFSARMTGLVLPAPSDKEIQGMCVGATYNTDENGVLGKKAFKDLFMRRFLHGIILRVAAHIMTNTAIVPAAALLFHAMGRFCFRLDFGVLTAFLFLVCLYLTRRVIAWLGVEGSLADALGANEPAQFTPGVGGYQAKIFNVLALHVLRFWASYNKMQRSSTKKLVEVEKGAAAPTGETGTTADRPRSFVQEM